MRRHQPRRGAALGLPVAVIMVLSGCGAGTGHVAHPFAFTAEYGVSSGPGSGAWGDTYSGPKGNRLGCIRGRKLAILIAVHNRTKRTVTLLGGGGPQIFPRIIERVAVQVRLAPPPPTGDIAVTGLRSWSPRASSPVAIPPGRDADVQSNFLMRNCTLLRSIEPVTVNRSTTLLYSADGGKGAQVVAVAAARIILTRGPRHPVVPINQSG